MHREFSINESHGTAFRKREMPIDELDRVFAKKIKKIWGERMTNVAVEIETLMRLVGADAGPQDVALYIPIK